MAIMKEENFPSIRVSQKLKDETIKAAAQEQENLSEYIRKAVERRNEQIIADSLKRGGQTGGKVMKIYGDEINYNLETDKIVKTIDEPTYMTDRKRESLRVTADGTYYLHTNNDRENELIVTTSSEIEQWAEKYDIEL